MTTPFLPPLTQAQRVPRWIVDKHSEWNEYWAMWVSPDPERDYEASVDSYGCVNLHWGDEYIHICDLDDYIGRLVELQERAALHFVPLNGVWPR